MPMVVYICDLCAPIQAGLTVNIFVGLEEIEILRIADMQLMATAVQQDWRALRYVDTQCARSGGKHYRALLLQAIEQNGWAYRFIPDEAESVRKDSEIVEKVIMREPWCFRFMPEAVRSCEEIAHQVARHSGAAALRFSIHTPSDAVIRAAVDSDPAAIMWVPKERLRRGHIVGAVSRNPFVLGLLSDDIWRADKEYVLRTMNRLAELGPTEEALLVERMLCSKSYCPETLRESWWRRDDVEEAFEDPYTESCNYSSRIFVLRYILQRCEGDLLNDREIISAAVRACGLCALVYAGGQLVEELQECEHPVEYDLLFLAIDVGERLTAVATGTGTKLETEDFITEDFLQAVNRIVCRKKIVADFYQHCEEARQLSPSGTLEAHGLQETLLFRILNKWPAKARSRDFWRDWGVFGDIAVKLLKDRSIPTAATIGACPWLFGQEGRLCVSFRHDPVCATLAFQADGFLLSSAVKKLKNCKELACVACSSSGAVLEFVGDSLKRNPEVVLAAVASDGLALRFASPELQDNPQVVQKAVQQCGTAIAYASNRLRRDREVAEMAVRSNGNAMLFICPDFRKDPTLLQLALKSGWRYFCLCCYRPPGLQQQQEGRAATEVAFEDLQDEDAHGWCRCEVVHAMETRWSRHSSDDLRVLCCFRVVI